MIRYIEDLLEGESFKIRTTDESNNIVLCKGHVVKHNDELGKVVVKLADYSLLGLKHLPYGTEVED